MHNNIKKIRTMKGIQLQEISKNLSVPISLIEAWELGITMPSLEQVLYLSKLFKTPIDDLLSLENIERKDISFLSNTHKEIVYKVYNSFILINKYK